MQLLLIKKFKNDIYIFFFCEIFHNLSTYLPTIITI